MKALDIRESLQGSSKVTMASTRLVGEHNRTERVTSRTGAGEESRLA